jgi:hypothetical protein
MIGTDRGLARDSRQHDVKQVSGNAGDGSASHWRGECGNRRAALDARERAAGTQHGR